MSLLHLKMSVFQNAQLCIYAIYQARTLIPTLRQTHVFSPQKPSWHLGTLALSAPLGGHNVLAPLTVLSTARLAKHFCGTGSYNIC